MVKSAGETLQKAREAVARVTDPEIPDVSIVDLGIVRSIAEQEGTVVVTITPTYSGCPAMHVIEMEIESALRAAGIGLFRIEKVLSPAWTTAWITESGKRKLSRAGIAPPASPLRNVPVAVELEKTSILCPACQSAKTALVSQFGPTACKALYRCTDCLSTFEYFKSI